MRPEYLAAGASGQSDDIAVVVGEAVGLIDDIRPAASVVAEVTAEAERLLRERKGRLL